MLINWKVNAPWKDSAIFSMYGMLQEGFSECAIDCQSRWWDGVERFSRKEPE